MVNRVLMTTDTVGGVWTYSLDLARWLGRRHVAVTIAAIGIPTEEQVREVAAIPNADFHWSDYKLEWMPDSWQDVDASGEWLLDLQVEAKADVVHLNQYSFGRLNFGAPKVVVAHSCVLSWWEAVKGESAPLEDWSTYRENVAEGLSGADLIVAPSKAMMRDVCRTYSPSTEVRVIPNARDTEFLAPGRKMPCVFSAGRLWDEAKNVRTLDEAADKCIWMVCVAGEGGETKAARSLGHLTAHEMQSWLSESAIYALPALYEPFGLSVLEAAISGCALVLGDIPSLRENWDGAALFVPPRDPDALARAINSLAENPPLLAEASALALNRSKQFNQDRTADAYLAAYEHVLGSSRARAYAS